MTSTSPFSGLEFLDGDWNKPDAREQIGGLYGQDQYVSFAEVAKNCDLKGVFNYQFSLNPDNKEQKYNDEIYYHANCLNDSPMFDELLSLELAPYNTPTFENHENDLNHKLSQDNNRNQPAMNEEDKEETEAVFDTQSKAMSTEPLPQADEETASEQSDSEESAKPAVKRASTKIAKPKSKIVVPANLLKAKKEAQKKSQPPQKPAANGKKSDRKVSAEYIRAICYKLFLQQDRPELKAAMASVYQDEEVRDLVLSIIPNADKKFEEHPSEKTFREIIMTPFENPHRKDELQKKTLSKITHYIYKKEYKFKSKIPKTEAQLKMKLAFDLLGEEKRIGFESNKEEIFERLFGSDRKMGMHNDVVREILTNGKLFERMLKYEFLNDVLHELDEQTKSDIETNIVSKFETSTVEELRAAAFSEDGKKKQSFKLPWSRLHNIEALLTFLDKLQYRALKENFHTQNNYLRDLIASFERDSNALKRPIATR